MIKLPIFALGPPHRKLVAYDSANRLANLSLGGTGVPPVYSVDYGYDTRGLMTTVTSGDYATAYQYRANGQLLSTVNSRLSTPQGDILRADRSYDAGARLLGVANTAANNDQAGVVYTLGIDDQRLTATEETGEKWDYGYDGLKQLVTAKKTDTGAVVVPPLDQSYTYDPMGNRRAYADQSASTAYTANNANQYTAVGGIASVYDANGNLLSDGVKNYAWDAENQLIAVAPVSPVTGSQKVEYTYDWRMRRTGKKSYTYTSGAWVLEKTTGFKYHEWNPIEETITDNPLSSPVTSLKSYVWGNDLSGNLHGAGGVGGLLSMKYNSDSYFYAYDGNGNVRALVKADAANPAASAITARYAYDGFGKEVTVSGADADKNAFRFSTKQLDAETGMNYYGYRYYATNAGRWINRDPIVEEGGMNVYAMVGNDAIDFWDLKGLDAFGGPTPFGPHTGGIDYTAREPSVLDQPFFGPSAGSYTGEEAYFERRFSNMVDVMIGKYRDSINQQIESQCNGTAGPIGAGTTLVDPASPTNGYQQFGDVSATDAEKNESLGSFTFNLTGPSITYGEMGSDCCKDYSWTAQLEVLDRLGYQRSDVGRGRMADILLRLAPSRVIKRAQWPLDGHGKCCKKKN